MASILINEIFYDPAGPDSGKQWVELLNNTNQDIDISSWQIQGAGSFFKTIYTFPTGSIIKANKLLTVGEGQTTANIIVNSLPLQNGGSMSDGLRLVDSIGTVMDVIVYDSPNTNKLTNEVGQTVLDTQVAITASAGFSLGRTNTLNVFPKTTDLNDSYQDFFIMTPSINKFNTINPLPQPNLEIWPLPLYSNIPVSFILLNKTDYVNLTYTWFLLDSKGIEVTNSDLPDWNISLSAQKYKLMFEVKRANQTLTVNKNLTVGDAISLANIKLSEVLPAPNKTQEEFIEITNLGNKDLPLKGFALTDNSQKLDNFVIEEQIYLSAHTAMIFPKSQTKITLNNNADTVYLVNPEGQIIHQMSYEKAPAGKSLCLGQPWQSCIPSPGKLNEGILAHTGISYLSIVGVMILSVIIILVIYKLLNYKFWLKYPNFT